MPIVMNREFVLLVLMDYLMKMVHVKIKNQWIFLIAKLVLKMYVSNVKMIMDSMKKETALREFQIVFNITKVMEVNVSSAEKDFITTFFINVFQ